MKQTVATHGLPQENGTYRIEFDNGDLNPIVRTVRVVGDCFKMLPDGGTFDLQGNLQPGDVWEKISD